MAAGPAGISVRFLLPLLAALIPAGVWAQDPLLIREVISREMSIHVGGVEVTPQKEIVSRELSIHVENGSSDLVHEVVSREYDLLVDSPGTPPAVTAVTATLSPTGTTLTLDWTAYNPWAVRDVEWFYIYLSDAGPITDLAGLTRYTRVGGAVTRITISGLAEYQDHYYAVVAVDGQGNRITTAPARAAYVLSPEIVSREVSLFIGQEPEPPYKEVVSREYDLAIVTPEPPPAIDDVLVSVSATGDSATLDWSAYNQWAVGDIQRFDIYLSDEGPFSDISGREPFASVGGGSTSITLNPLTPLRDHHFAVVPVDALGNRIAQVTPSTGYVLMPELVSREVSLFVGQEPEPPYKEVVSRETSLVVADDTVPAPVTGIDSGFLASTSTSAGGAVDLDWAAYNEVAQRDVSRYRIYVAKEYFDNVTGMKPYQILQNGAQRATLTGFVGLSIHYFAVVAEDAFGNFNPVVRPFSAQASYTGRPMPLGREYLVNGGAESGDTIGWNGVGLVAARADTRPPEGLGDQNTLGDFIFVAAPGAEPGPLVQLLSQSVNLAAVAELIDAGYQRYSFQALLQSHPRQVVIGGQTIIVERAEAELHFRDARGDTTGRVILADTDIAVADWRKVEEFGTVPPGSRTVDVLLKAVRFSGTQTRVGFDNVSFILTNAEFLRRVDLDATVHLPGSPVQLALEPGRYQIRPVQGGRFEAWHGWLNSLGNTGDGSSPDRLDTGWQWSYALALPSVQPRVVARDPAAGCFAMANRAYDVNAIPFDLVLRTPETLEFYLPDPADSGADNGGGISLIVERPAAQHDAVAHPLGPLPYRSFADSPFRAVNFAAGRFHLEDAEDAPLLGGVAGVTITNNASGGSAYTRRGPGPLTDSVDGDDGVLDGAGTAGGSIAPATEDGSEWAGATISFRRSTLGYLPTHAGVVFTDGSPAEGVVVDFHNEDGLLVATIGPARVGDDSRQGTAADDHFFGVVYRGGIASMTIAVPGGGGTLELDHLQFGYAAEPSVPAAFPPAHSQDPELLKAGEVRAAIRLPDGSLVLGGGFTAVGGIARSGLARLAADGTPSTWQVVLDPAPGQGPVLVSALAVHDGQLFLGGRFGAVNGTPCRNLAAVSLADAGLIDPWNPAPADEVVALAVDGNALFVALPASVAKFDLSGATIAADEWSGITQWMSDPTHRLRTIRPHGGHLYLGGSFASMQGFPCAGIARIDAGSGAVDRAWNPALDPSGQTPAAQVRVEQLLADAGGVVALGARDDLPAATAGFLRKVTTNDGQPAAGWTVLTDTALSAMAAGPAHLYLAFRDGRVRRLDPASGAIDPGWQPQAGGAVQVLLPAADHTLLLGGFNAAGGTPALGHAAVDPGTAAVTAGPAVSAPGEVFAFARQPDGKLLIGGDFQWLRGAPINQLARLLPGSDRHDTAWQPAIRGGAVRAITIAGDEVFVGGDFIEADGLEGSLVKYELFADAPPLSGWQPAVSQVTALATDADHVFVAGRFPAGSGVGPLGRVARRGAGAVDPAWAPAITRDGQPPVIHRLLLHAGHLYLGGEFSQVGSGTRSSIARLDPATGQLDSEWMNLNLVDPAGVSVRDFLVDGRFLYVGGRFTEAQGSPQPHLARFAAVAVPAENILEGAFDTSWRPVLTEPAGALLALGENLLAAVDGVVACQTGDNPAPRTLAAADGPVRTLASEPGRILAGGSFGRFGGVAAGGFAATPFLGTPRLTFRDGKVFIYPDDGTGPFVGEFEITAIRGGSLVDTGGVTLAAGARVSAAAGAAGLTWLPAGGASTPAISVVAVPPTAPDSDSDSPPATATNLLGDDPQTPHFAFATTPAEGYEVYEGDVLSVPVRYQGPAEVAGTVGYEILSGTARRYNGSTGDYVDAILPLEFVVRTQVPPQVPPRVVQGEIRVPVIEDGIVEGAEEFSIRLVNPSAGIALGAANQVRVRIIDGGRRQADGVQPSVLDPLKTRPPGPYVPGASNSLTVHVDPPVAGAAWRLRGEFQWRQPGTGVSMLRDKSAAADSNEHWVEFRPVANHQTPLPEKRRFDQQQSLTITATYQPVAVAPGTLQVVLTPADLGAAPQPADRARWRPLGEALWRDSNESMSLPAGTHLIEFQGGIGGWLPPGIRAVEVAGGEVTLLRAAYAESRSASHPPVPLPFDGSPGTPAAVHGPFHFVGRIVSRLGAGTGTAVNEQTVLTAARLLWDPDTLSNSEPDWFHQDDPTAHRAAPRRGAAFVLGGYASQLVAERAAGTGHNPLGNLASDNLDVGVLGFFHDSAARAGSSGFLADYSPVPGFNPWLLGTADKLLCGYPDAGTASPWVMHATAPCAEPLAPVQQQVYASAALQGLPGMAGSPLFCRHPNGSFYPAAVYLGENGGARFRGLDRNVAELIHRMDYIIAVYKASSGGTGGGDEFIDPLEEDDFPIGSVKVEIPNGVGRWRIVDTSPPHVARSTWLHSGETVPILAGAWAVEFEPLPGMVAPSRQSLAVGGGDFAVVAAAAGYAVTRESWTLTAFTDAERANPLVSAPDADPDGDGLTNLTEFAFGLPPKSNGRPAFDLASATPGLPVIRLVPGTQPPRFEVRFLRRNPQVSPGLVYQVEFADHPAGPWTAAPAPAETVEPTIDPNWQHVKVDHAPPAPAGRMFTRVRVEQTPAP